MFSRPVLSAVLPSVAVILALAGCSVPVGDASEGGSSGIPSSEEGTAQSRESSGQLSAESEYAVVSSDAVQAQLDYVLEYWSDYNDEYGAVDGNDCVNFTSQSLLARGWSETDEWYHGGDSVWDSSSAWVSSTAFADYLSSRPDLVSALDDSQRDQVAIGDIVQFDWDRSGDRDHTGVVTRIEYTGDGTLIYFAGHTDDSDYRSVDEAITVSHPGADVYYWHVAD